MQVQIPITEKPSLDYSYLKALLVVLIGHRSGSSNLYTRPTITHVCRDQSDPVSSSDCERWDRKWRHILYSTYSVNYTFVCEDAKCQFCSTDEIPSLCEFLFLGKFFNELRNGIEQISCQSIIGHLVQHVRRQKAGYSDWLHEQKITKSMLHAEEECPWKTLTTTFKTNR